MRDSLSFMQHSIPKIIELKHQFNKVIGKGKSRQRFSTEFASRDRSTMVGEEGQILDKPIQIYRMWYRFLQLALELEEQKVQIVLRTEKVKLKKPTKDQWGKLQTFERRPVVTKVKVNRKIYKSWDLEIIPNTAFDDWWFGRRGVKSHRELFYPDTSVSIVQKQDDWVDHPNYTYIRIDKRRRMNDVVTDLRVLLSEHDRSVVSLSEFPIFGTPNINTLINRYNVLVKRLISTETNERILASDLLRPTTSRVNPLKDIEGVYRLTSPGSTMRDLLNPAKIALLSVCDGYFIKNPNKDYL